jgi:hypothetical protein
MKMATKKNAIPAEEEVQAAVPAEESETPKNDDVWSQMVDVVVPRKPKGEDQNFYICINDRRFYIPANGKVQKLPLPVAEILADSLEDEAKAEDYMDSMPNRDGSNPVPHAIQ